MCLYQNAIIIDNHISNKKHTVKTINRNKSMNSHLFPAYRLLESFHSLAMSTLPCLKHLLSLQLSRAQTLGLHFGLLTMSGGQVDQPAVIWTIIVYKYNDHTKYIIL